MNILSESRQISMQMANALKFGDTDSFPVGYGVIAKAILLAGLVIGDGLFSVANAIMEKKE